MVTLEERLQLATNAYNKGYTCAQAVFAAYAQDIHMEEGQAYRLMEGFSHGLFGGNGICGLLIAASAIISYYCCDGAPCSDHPYSTYEYLEKFEKIWKKGYGDISCKGVRNGYDKVPFTCDVRIKDCILILDSIIEDIQSENS